FRTHIDRCLGCRACEQVCPAGVEYGQLLESSREELLRAQPKSDLTDRMLRFVLRRVWLSPPRLRLLFCSVRLFRDLGLATLLRKSGIARLFSRRAEFGFALLESSRPIFNTQNRSTQIRQPAQSASTVERVLLFTGCVGEGLFARVNRATERVLRAN